MPQSSRSELYQSTVSFKSVGGGGWVHGGNSLPYQFTAGGGAYSCGRAVLIVNVTAPFRSIRGGWVEGEIWRSQVYTGNLASAVYVFLPPIPILGRVS